jgi:chromate transporter
MTETTKLKEACLLFFRLGFTSFGGPAAHIALMEKEVVNKKQWMTREHFLDLIGTTNLIPGPNSTEMAMHCGYNRAGALGLWLAGFCFIFPAFIITGIFAWVYRQYGALPAIEPFFYGVKPAVIAIILDAVFKFGRKALKNWQLGLIGAATLAGALLRVNAIFLIFTAGFIGILWLSGFKGNLKTIFPFTLLQVGNVLPYYSTTKLFFVFLKIGSILFGSGYVLFAYLDGDLVQHLHWLTRKQLMDAVAAGQFTPGPVLSTATFIGYQISGVKGAIASTVGIFLPSFIFVWLLTPIIPKLRKSNLTSAFLDSVNIASVALMLAVTIQMGYSTLVDWKTWSIALLGFGCLLQFKKLNAVWVVAAGALLGYAMRALI